MEREKRKGLMEEEMKDGTKNKNKKKKNEKKMEEEPTDEEVDEFFRILKRMHAAMEYFGGVDSKLLSSRKWSCSEAMVDEQQGLEEVEDDDDEKLVEESSEEKKKKKKKKKIKSENWTLDLNADPK